MTLQHQLPLSHALGWAGPELLDLAKDYPGLALQLLTLPKQRLHFVAFVLAMTAAPVSADLVHQAVTLPAREVLRCLGLSEVQGIRRVLGRIYGPILERDRYREIAGLLSEPTTARVLHHASEVTPELLANLSALPLTLRSPVITDAIGHIPNAAVHLIEWTEIVAARLPKLSVRDVQERVGDSCSFIDLKTRLTRLLDALPALEAPPPRVVHHAMRVDAPSAIRLLGKQFINCLDNFVDVEIDGSSHIYHWRKDHAEAVCEVTRVGNLGWFLGSHLGPENMELGADLSRTIQVEFRAFGIHQLKVVETYDDLFYAVGRRNRNGVNDTGQFTARNRRRHLP
jgi:hypothetical protein